MKDTQYDYLIVGAGLFGAVFAREATDQGKKVLVIDKRNHTGGNIYCENVEGVNVHKYGAHIFHTSNQEVWDYVNRFVSFNHYVNSPIARYEDKLYNLPFNMNTFYQLWGVTTPQEAKDKIAEERAPYADLEPQNLEEQALFLGGKDLYEKLIKGYTEKQWGRPATQIPSFIIKRLPFRFTFDNNYFNDLYQGIPIGGYNALTDALLEGVEVRTGVNYFENAGQYNELADKVLYTGKIDEFFDCQFGQLEYRSLHFETEVLDQENYQGNAVVNYTERDVPYTRILEHKHFEFGTQDKTVVTKEYPHEFSKDNEPYYPINDETNNALLARYQELAKTEPYVNKFIFGGRLANYKYYDMDDTIEAALALTAQELV
ncbi:UDP-galactopyranose mutase [Pseudoalteromonas luteoviolacea]|uniref:UDP-galactopyranose mutase n=1 Tax=Pseudoalteromonas luteoviolacea H33 TaxID=1365251 RepID=A0A167B9F6_9GAMM|nr:UDP-galactopyranose mutase [Pseudoalteromonas luteoviolacea]KZN46284.1 UDP-galactopyranose mutase [Pseudoalteromonas luteoviolacea H33]KZN75061.1 UDP-galactopyranose mutase [Pseudoalteromonas luteoviolacea H33-S]MBQ4875923.1 UDP-galactopyranose mutase [Pseudoalteromonas luteoviolacea]MBQ4904958.1 UDP-galactopyranose mutase [Pseudoalteromonas luteoviolacea]